MKWCPMVTMLPLNKEIGFHKQAASLFISLQSTPWQFLSGCWCLSLWYVLKKIAPEERATKNWMVPPPPPSLTHSLPPTLSVALWNWGKDTGRFGTFSNGKMSEPISTTVKQKQRKRNMVISGFLKVCRCWIAPGFIWLVKVSSFGHVLCL